MDRSEQMESYLRQQLSAWIHLSLRENLSNSLLLMLQVFNITQVCDGMSCLRLLAKHHEHAPQQSPERRI